jgi:hypothetical protein
MAMYIRLCYIVTVCSIHRYVCIYVYKYTCVYLFFSTLSRGALGRAGRAPRCQRMERPNGVEIGANFSSESGPSGWLV